MSEPSPAPAEAVTLVVVNARVRTGDPRRPWADALVVRGATLALVGGSAEARKLAAAHPAARVVDAAAATVAPLAADGRLTRGAPADFALLDAGGAPALRVAGGRVVHDAMDAASVAPPAPPAAGP